LTLPRRVADDVAGVVFIKVQLLLGELITVEHDGKH